MSRSKQFSARGNRARADESFGADARQAAPCGVACPRNRLILSCVLLALGTLALYWPARTFEFVNYDDPAYVTQNPNIQQGFTWKSICWAFTSVHASNWHPLTWLSHMLDVTLFGLAPGPQHMVNVVLHTLNAALVLLVFRRMTGGLGPPFLIAALFAWHPLHVESVAWIAERKDLLSASFWLLTIWCYVGYCRALREDRRKANLLYAGVVVCFSLGLLSKPMVVTLPMVLLLLDVWPLERVKLDAAAGWRKVLIEKIPLLTLSAAVSAATFLAQRQSGAVAALDQVPLPGRVLNAVVAYAMYLRKLVWPSDLAVFYPHPGAWPTSVVILSAGILILITGTVVIRMHRTPWMFAGWFWYLGALVPVIGLVQVGNQAFADRYTYLPILGVFLAVAYQLPQWQRNSARLIIPTACAALLIACFWASARQLEHWKNSDTLMRRALAVTRNNHVAHHNLGYSLAEAGKVDEARTHYEAAIAILPDYHDAHLNLGLLLLGRNLPLEAEHHFAKAASLNPGSTEAHYGHGLSFGMQGRHKEAAECFRRALELSPDYVNARYNLGNALVETGELRAAEEQYRAALTAGQKQGVGEARLSVVRRQLDRLRQRQR